MTEEVTITFSVTISGHERRRLLTNSIERVMNNAIKIGAYAESQPGLKSMQEDASILWQDCEELKPLVTRIWWAAQEAARTA